jgi:pimeloyl-ACP methyl ester carboxylesterase
MASSHDHSAYPTPDESDPTPSDVPRLHPLTAIRGVVTRVTATVLVILLGLIATLAFGQRSLIYHPRPEPANLVLPPDAIRIQYSTADGRQAALYLPPSQGQHKQPPETLWVLCSGNASIGTDWLEYLQREVRGPKAGPRRVAHLLVDYPGYGICEGKPTEASIQRTMEAVLPALAEQMGWTLDDTRRDLRVLGFSLGAAAALKLAAREPVREVLLLAPFSTLRDAASHAVGPILSLVVADRFDNKARIRDLAATADPPPVTIYHGTADRVVPYAQGQALATLYGDRARLVLVDGAGHDLGGDAHWQEITRKLRGLPNP